MIPKNIIPVAALLLSLQKVLSPNPDISKILKDESSAKANCLKTAIPITGWAIGLPRCFGNFPKNYV